LVVLDGIALAQYQDGREPCGYREHLLGEHSEFAAAVSRLCAQGLKQTVAKFTGFQVIRGIGRLAEDGHMRGPAL
jgi:hypothetical protein